MQLFQDIVGGTAGLIISSTLMLNISTQYGIRQSAEFENQMTSVERIVEYQDLVQESSPKSVKMPKPDANWPTKGEIIFDKMSLSYDLEAKPVLRNLECKIKGGEKIGIVGRTGAGKSSMIAALFRLTEPTGSIRIDGIDTQSVVLDDLRKKISIIPQDPVVFSGTVRYNLDPFSEYGDDELWSTLDKVQLKSQIENLPGKLDAHIADGGSNLSVGQRQLICLARAILRRNRILVLDEATANVDHQTDSLIQNTIRSEFKSCTVLTIAHRLNTIIDCDRVLVLDAGQIAEFGTPYQLLNEQNLFYEMCHKTGPSMYDHLYQMAKLIHNKKITSYQSE